MSVMRRSGRMFLDKVELGDWVFDLTVDYAIDDVGIGAYEFWGARGVDSRLGVDEFDVVEAKLVGEYDEPPQLNGATLEKFVGDKFVDELFDLISDRWDAER